MNYRFSFGCSVVSAAFALLLTTPLNGTTHAAEPVVIPGTAWTIEGVLSAKAKGKRSSSNVSIGLFFGPQTVTTFAGDVDLGNNQYVMALPESADERMMVGTYVTKKRKAALSGGASVDKLIVGLLEAAFGEAFDGSLITQKFKMKAKFQARNDQDAIDVKLKVKASVSGDLDGGPISGKLRVSRCIDRVGGSRLHLPGIG